ncbi:hypothetical protein [Pisciglobus halotolerans]|uniref:Uncharacterized protein YoxC, contains an MCP-like domain n=1 Tax=Pisciglobus halotolerans TaxID=745365 RepID=A0A1I3BR53_9LACT|nr:hypothetical protein [Pisciglobus halotolerans]SFH64566.1 Uncharacterized protein YoxC, contains an MCP-like domain [Pisciglobus halotolerans]
MSIGFIIALVILVLAIVGLAVAGIIIGKNISRVMNDVNNTMVNVNSEVDRFKKAADAIKGKVTNMQQRVNGMTKNVEDKQAYIAGLSEKTTEFSHSINHLKVAGNDLSNQFMSSPIQTVKKAVPMATKVQRTAKKVIEKRKNK